MGTNFTDALAGGEVGHVEVVVGGDGVEEGGAEGPLEVENGGFGLGGEEAVVRVGGVCPPEGFTRIAWSEGAYLKK